MHLGKKLQGKTNILHIHSILGAVLRNWKLEVSANESKVTLIPDYNVTLNKKTTTIQMLTSNKIYWEIVISKIKPATAYLA